MTPVEERIDHEGDEIGSTVETDPAEIAAMAVAGLVIREVEVETLGRSYLAMRKALKLAYPYVKDCRDEERPGPVRDIIEADLAVIGPILSALPATESAQPEEEQGVS